MNRRLLSLHIAAAFVFLILVAVGYRTGASVATQRLTLRQAAPTSEPTATPAPTDIPILFTRGEKWNTYADKKEGFSVSFPAVGLIYRYFTQALTVGECGLNISRPKPYQGSSITRLVSIDGLFEVDRQPITGTLLSLIRERDPKGKNTYPALAGTGCDEAYAVAPHTHTGGIPFSYTLMLCRKDKTLYSVTDPWNGSPPEGCSPITLETSQAKGSDFPVLKQYADWEKHINFTLLP